MEFLLTGEIRPVSNYLSNGKSPCRNSLINTIPLILLTYCRLFETVVWMSGINTKNAAHRINRNLKQIGKQIGLSIPLTTYVARHAWASIAQSKNVSLSVISEALGHDSEQTTRIYLASLDTSVVDKANSLILKSI